LRRAQNEFGLRIKKIRSDNGTEFKNSQIEGFLEDEGIKHEFSSPYTTQQNGVVERKNRTLLDMARTMLDEYKTSDRFWAEAINTACYSINRLYLHRILKKTSYELLTGKKPNVSYFRVFGSCWGEGEDATLRSMPSPASLHQRRQDDWQTYPSSRASLDEGPMTRSSRPAASSNMEAHV
jgi:transposase InsO family protein